MNHSMLWGLTIGAGLACIFHYRKSQNRMYLTIGIVAIVATLAAMAVR